MTLANATWMLTALAGVVILLTRSRLAASEAQSGVTAVSRRFVDSHTAAGVLALAAWVWWLSGGPRGVGLVGVVLWWVVVVIGLVILARWLPSHGSHSTGAIDDGWAAGPWLSVLGHIGMLLGVAYFTWVFFADKI